MLLLVHSLQTCYKYAYNLVMLRVLMHKQGVC